MSQGSVSGKCYVGCLDTHYWVFYYIKEKNKWAIEETHWGWDIGEYGTFTDLMGVFYENLVADADEFLPSMWKKMYNEMFPE